MYQPPSQQSWQFTATAIHPLMSHNRETFVNLKAEDTCSKVNHNKTPRCRDRIGLEEADYTAESDIVTPRREASCTFVYLTSVQAFVNTKYGVFLPNTYKPFSRWNSGPAVRSSICLVFLTRNSITIPIILQTWCEAKRDIIGKENGIAKGTWAAWTLSVRNTHVRAGSEKK